jgi:hypothetical protein
MLPRAAADGPTGPSAPPSSGRGALEPIYALAEALADESRLVASAAVFVAVLIWNLHLQVNQDAWLALAAGRTVFEHGLPHHDWLGIWTAGRSWVDQQWLGQLSFYGVESLGGLRLLAGVHVVLISGAFVGAIVVGRRMGGSSRSVLYLIPLAFPLLAQSMWQVRTQSLAFPLFVAVVALLARDARAPSRRVYVVLAFLCVWANIHGSVVLGAALTSVRGLDLLARGSRRRGAVLTVGGPLCLIASPYGLHLVSYYASTLLNPSFAKLVNEWQPTTVGLLTGSFFVLLAGAAWLRGRARGALTRFEWLAIAVIGAAGLDAVRNVGYFALVALMLLPAALDQAWPPQPSPSKRRLDAVIAVTALAVVALAGMNVFEQPASALRGADDPRAAATVARAAERSGGRVLADVRYADWLIWQQPSLASRIAYDIRFELLSQRQLAEIYTFNDPLSVSWRTASAGYALLVLDRTDDAVAVRALSREPGTRVIYSGRELVVFERSPAKPGQTARG